MTAAYDAAVDAAITAQGLDAFRDMPGVAIEQTGGLTMVAFARRADGTATGITAEGDGFLVCDYPDAESEGAAVGEGWSLDAVRAYLRGTA